MLRRLFDCLFSFVVGENCESCESEYRIDSWKFVCGFPSSDWPIHCVIFHGDASRKYLIPHEALRPKRKKRETVISVDKCFEWTGYASLRA